MWIQSATQLPDRELLCDRQFSLEILPRNLSSGALVFVDVMMNSPSLKSLPAPVRTFIRPMLFAALGLHALLLFTPFPSEQKPKTPDDKKDPVKITQIPTAKPNQSPRTKALPKVTRKTTLPKINRPLSASTIRTPQAATPTVSSVEQQAAASPAQNSQTPKNTTDPFQDFPHYQPSTPDCFNKGLGDSCRVTNGGLTAVASHYQKALPSKKYSITVDEQRADKQIYQVTKDGVTRYLHLFVDQPTTVILLAPEKIADIQALKGAVVPPDEYIELLGNVIPEGDRADAPATTAQYEQFDQPQAFFKPISDTEIQRGTIPELLPGVDGSPKIAADQPPNVLYETFLAADLKTIFKQVSLEGKYGGGDLYKLVSDQSTIYLNLVPLNGGKGTILVTWLRDPRS